MGTNQRVVPHLILISLAVNELATTRNKRRVIEYIMQQIPSLFIELQNAQGALLKLLDARERDDRKKGYWVLHTGRFPTSRQRRHSKVERSGGRRRLAELRRLRRICSRLWVRTTPKLNFHLRGNQHGEGQKSVSLQKTAEGKPRLTNLGSRPSEKCGKSA